MGFLRNWKRWLGDLKFGEVLNFTVGRWYRKEGLFRVCLRLAFSNFVSDRMLPEKVGFHRTQEAVCSCPLPALLQTVRKSRASDFGSSNRTNRGAIRPHYRRNVISVRKDFTSHKTSSSLFSGLNTPLFLHTLHRSRICKKF